MRKVFRNSAVKNGEKLHQDQEYVSTERIGNDQRQFLDRFPAGIKSGQFSERKSPAGSAGPGPKQKPKPGNGVPAPPSSRTAAPKGRNIGKPLPCEC